MRQTRSTIAFLQAAYKAVFKKAFFLGLATTTLVMVPSVVSANNIISDITDSYVIPIGRVDAVGDFEDHVVHIKKGGSLVVSGSYTENGGNVTFNNARLLVNKTHKLVIDQGGELVFNYLYTYPTTDLNQFLYLNGDYENHGDIIVGSEGYKYPDYIHSLVMLDNYPPNWVEKDKWVFSYQDGTRGNIVLGSNSVFEVRGQEDVIVNLNNISLAGVTQTQIDNRAWRANDTADIYYYIPSVPDAEKYSHINFSDLLATGSFDQQISIDVRGSLQLAGDSNNEFHLSNGSFGVTASFEPDPNLTLYLENSGSFNFNPYPGTDAKGLNLVLNGATKNAHTFVDFIDTKVNNINNITLNNGSFGLYEKSEVNSNGTFAIKHGRDNIVDDYNLDVALGQIDGGSSLSVAKVNIETPAIDRFVENDNDVYNAQLSGLHINNGSFTVKGTQDTNDVVYSDNSIALYGAGSTISFEKDALDLAAAGQENVLADGFGTIKSKAGSIINLNFDANTEIDDRARNKIKNQLLANGSVATINFGGASSGINIGKADENGRYSYEEFVKLNPDLDTAFTSNALTGNAFTVADDVVELQYTLGAAHVTGTNTVTVSGTHAGFVNSKVNNGFYASTVENGKDVAADIYVANDAILNLQNGGKADEILLGNNSTVAISSGGENTFKSIGGIKGVGGIAKISANTTVDSINVGTLQIEKTQVKVKDLSHLNQNFSIKDSLLIADNATIYDKATFGGEGFARADIKNLNLSTNTLVVNNNTNGKPSIVNIKTLDNSNILNIKGRLEVKGNSFLGLGYADLATFEQSLATNSFIKEDVVVDGAQGSYLIAYDALTLSDNASVLLGDVSAQKYNGQVYGYAAYANPNSTITFGKGGALVVDTKALSDNKVAVSFANGGSLKSIDGQEKVILVGDINENTSYKIFDSSLKVDANQTIAVESKSGFYKGTIDQTTNLDQGIKLELDTAGLINNTQGLSSNMKDFLLEAGKNPGDVTQSGAKFISTYLGNVQSADLYTVEKVARLAPLAGVASASLGVSNTASEAIDQRLKGTLAISSNNGLGYGVWLSPVYQNTTVDEIESQGLISGLEYDLSGASLGVDYKFNPNFLVGFMANFGTGSSNSTDIGGQVDNDFDYYGFGLYGKYEFNNFYVNSDLTYNVVSNDIDTNTALTGYNHFQASTDSSVVSLGLEAGYTFNGVVDITPHAGIRYSLLSVDSYNVESDSDFVAPRETVAHSDFDDMSVLSIPVGVKFEKSFAVNNWQIKPYADLELVFYTGDQHLEYSTTFPGLNNKLNLKTEVLDDLSYGTTVGVNAQAGNLGLGLGLNYLGSDNYTNLGFQLGASYKF